MLRRRKLGKIGSQVFAPATIRMLDPIWLRSSEMLSLKILSVVDHGIPSAKKTVPTPPPPEGFFPALSHSWILHTITYYCVCILTFPAVEVGLRAVGRRLKPILCPGLRDRERPQADRVYAGASEDDGKHRLRVGRLIQFQFAASDQGDVKDVRGESVGSDYQTAGEQGRQQREDQENQALSFLLGWQFHSVIVL